MEKQVAAASLELSSYSVNRGRTEVIHAITLALTPGTTVLLGPNGAGKSTLLEALAVLRVRPPGLLKVNGANVTGQGERSTTQMEFGFLPQTWLSYRGFTASEQVQYGAWLKGLPSAALPQAARDALAAVNMDEYRNVQIRKLSGGQQRRVGLAEATVHNPSVLLLDEPTAGLDPLERLSFRRSLLNTSSNRVVLMSTHLIGDVESTADRVIILDAGQVKFNGTADELLSTTAAKPGLSRLEAAYANIIGA